MDKIAQLITRIDALCEGATPAPWKMMESADAYRALTFGDETIGYLSATDSDDDARLIITLRNAWPEIRRALSSGGKVRSLSSREAGQESAPAGWRMVPVKATPAMTKSASAVMADSGMILHYDDAAAVYKAMLSAAPAAAGAGWVSVKERLPEEPFWWWAPGAIAKHSPDRDYQVVLKSDYDALRQAAQAGAGREGDLTRKQIQELRDDDDKWDGMSYEERDKLCDMAARAAREGGEK